MTLTSDSPASITAARGLSLALGQGGGVSGGTPALSWSADALTDGGIITIATDGTNSFGSKITQSPVVWDMGSDFRNLNVPLPGHAAATDGASIAWAGIFDQAFGTITTTRPHRHPRIDRHYFGAETTLAFCPYGPLLRSDTQSRKHYSCFRIRVPVDLRKVRTSVISNMSGDFDQGEPGELGEPLTVTVSGNDYPGRLIAIKNGLMSFAATGVSISSGTGQVLVAGDLSGASATLDTTAEGFQTAPPGKLYRINQQAIDGVLSVLALGLEQVWIESNLDGFDPIDMDRYANKLSYEAAANYGDWLFVETYQDWSTPSALTAQSMIIGGKGRVTSELPPVDGSANYLDMPLSILMIGMDSSVNHNLNIDFGEVYVDETPQRVVIGDNADYSLCSNIEIQFVKSWVDDEIKAEFYQGAFDSLSGKHLFIFDEQNQPMHVGKL